MLALAPDEVRAERSTAGPIPAMVDLVRYGVQPLSETGVLGDPTAATAEHGDELFDDLAEHLARAVADWAG